MSRILNKVLGNAGVPNATGPLYDLIHLCKYGEETEFAEIRFVTQTHTVMQLFNWVKLNLKTGWEGSGFAFFNSGTRQFVTLIQEAIASMETDFGFNACLISLCLLIPAYQDNPSARVCKMRQSVTKFMSTAKPKNNSQFWETLLELILDSIIEKQDDILGEMLFKWKKIKQSKSITLYLTQEEECWTKLQRACAQRKQNVPNEYEKVVNMVSNLIRRPETSSPPY